MEYILPIASDRMDGQHVEALDSIEKRIDQLTRILGADETTLEERPAGAESLTDSLLSANTLMASAMSGRQGLVVDFIKRSQELEKYLDPDFLDEQQKVKAKEVYLNTVAPELVESFEQLEEIKQLEPTLGAEYFRTMPNVSAEKLKAMNETTAALAQKNDLLEETLTLAMQRYDEIQQNLKESLQSMNERIDRMENRLKEQTKKVDADI